MFTPTRTRTQCPVSTDRLENYRRTTIKRRERYNKDDRGSIPTSRQSKPGRANSAERRDSVQVKERYNTARHTTTATGGKAAAIATERDHNIESHTTSNTIQTTKRRITGKQPRQTTQQQQSETTGTGQGIPHPSELQPGGDYWYREGILEASPRTTTHILLHTRANRRWTGRLEVEHVQANKDTTSSRRQHQGSTGRMDKTHLGLAGQTSRNKNSTRHNWSQTTKNSNRAERHEQYKHQNSRDTRTQRDTPSVQELVSNMRTGSRSGKQSPEATEHIANHTTRLRIPKRLRR